jgi:hypothetical protein
MTDNPARTRPYTRLTGFRAWLGTRMRRGLTPFRAARQLPLSGRPPSDHAPRR